MFRICGFLCVLGALALLPARVHAGDMDLTLGRLSIPPGAGGCSAGRCASNEELERLTWELSAALAPPVTRGAATVGPAGFYLGVATTLTPISASKTYWAKGTQGSGGAGSSRNASPSAALSWNRLDVRKGLPFGFELAAGLGQGLSTSMWVLAAELKWAIFEGYHSGMGQLPDVAISGVLQTTVGAKELTLRTNAINLTFSKPLVIAERYRLTPFAALQTMFLSAKTGRVDLTPAVDALEACDPSDAAATPGGSDSCFGDGSDLGRNVTFKPVSQTRLRIFLGAELVKEWFSTGLSMGFDVTTPAANAVTPLDNESGPLARQFTFQLSLGLRY